MRSDVDLTAVPSPEITLEFEEFFRTEYARLASALHILTGDREEAEDLAQEALSRVYERWGRVRLMSSPDGYLYRTAMNAARKRWRRLAGRPVGADPTGAQDPASTVERRATIKEALASLSRDQREVLVLVEWLGYPATEAARILGRSPEAVRARLHRARSALRERFGDGDV